MGLVVVSGATLKCQHGSTPSSLQVTSHKVISGAALAVATVADHLAGSNILPFGTCFSPYNPAVQASQSKSAPCQPLTAEQWMPGSATVLVGGKPALNQSSRCMCKWGEITIQETGQNSINVP